MTRGRPIGTEVGIYVDLVDRVEPGHVIETRSGRRYGVSAVRVQVRGTNAGRQHLRCVVLGPEVDHLEIARLVEAGPDKDDDGWHQCRRCKSPCSVPGGSGLEPTALCNLCAQDAAEILARAVLPQPKVHRIRWYRRGRASGGVKPKGRR